MDNWLSKPTGNYIQIPDDGSKRKPVENPFVLSLNMNSLDALKIVINFFWLFPLRLFLVACPSVVCGVILCSLIMLGRQDNQTPLTGWRKFLLQRVGYILNRFFLIGMGFNWIRIVGEPAPSKTAPVAVTAPHSSLLDMFLVSLKAGIPSFVARSENKDVPIFGRLQQYTFKCIFVSRIDGNSRQTCTNEIQRRLNSEYEWPPVMFFPEGTTTNRKSIIHFKHGAFGLGTPVQPILIRFNNRLNTMLWGDDIFDLAKGILLTFCQFHNSATIEYLSVYHPSEEEKDNPAIYASNVRKLMSETLSIPLSEHTFEDVSLMREAKRLGLPYGTGEVEFAKTCAPHNITLPQLKKLLQRFADIDSDKDGLISVTDLSQYLRVANGICLQSMFDKLDKNENRLITFFEYSRILIHSRSLVEDDQFITRVFQFPLDEDNDNLMTRNDLLKLLQFDNNNNNHCHHSSGPNVKKFNLLTRCSRQYQETTGNRVDVENGIASNSEDINILELPGPWNYDQFKILLSENIEYLLLFNEYLNAGLSNQST